MAKLSFILKKKPNNALHINAVLRDGEKETEKYTGYSIPALKLKNEYKHWDKIKQRVRAGHDDLEEINGKLSAWDAAFKEYLKKCKYEKIQPDIYEFKEMLSKDDTDVDSIKQKRIDDQLVWNINNYVAERSKLLKGRSLSHYGVLANDIIGYQEKENCIVKLKDINAPFFRKFARYLIAEEGNINSTVKRKITRIRTVAGDAFTNGRITTQRYKEQIEIKIADDDNNECALFNEEIAQLYNLEVKDKYAKMARDGFVLACETGLRYSDVCQLKGVHIKTLKTRKQVEVTVIDLTLIKGDSGNKIPLTDRAKEILARYTTPRADDNIFPFQHGQSINRALKRLFEDAKLKRPVEVVSSKGEETTRKVHPLYELAHFHLGRHSYITNLLDSGLPPVYVQRNAGHKLLTTTMGYYRGNKDDRWEETLEIQNRKP